MTVVAFLWLELLAITAINISFCNGSSYMGCIQSEREALLRFKQDLEDPSNRLASWNGDGDCCTWHGVVCNNFTGNVLVLHLTPSQAAFFLITFDLSAQIDGQRSRFGGKINPSLLNLKHLTYLDLSANNFEEIQIPEFLGSMGSLRYLNLSSNRFQGMIPHQLGNLSNLQYLDLGRNNDFQSLYVENFSWLSGLSLLKKLDLSNVNISKASKERLVINALPSLQFLRLSFCGLHRFPPLSFVNFSSLTFLDLSSNNFQGTIPDGLQNLTSLKYLDLGFNDFNSSVPNWLYKLSRLEDLSLGGNHWQGTISSAVRNLSFLKTLDLSSSNLEGGIPTSFRRFCNVRSISMSSMNLNQDISEVLEIFSKCVSAGLESLDLASSNLFGHLTNQLGQFKNLEFLNLFNNSISGPFPSSLGELSSLRVLVLSGNKLNGTLSEVHFSGLTKLIYFGASGSSLMFKNTAEWIPPFKLQILLLRSYHLGSQFPSWLHSQKHLLVLDISNSSILDTLPAYLFKAPFQIVYLNLSHNQIYGKIPNLMESSKLESLDLSSNNLSGPLPLTPFNMHELNLSNNSLSGSISHFLCYKMNEAKRLMQILILSKNFFHGELPDCLGIGKT
ncbi:receptor-like protein EIX1 [Pistacia vera]|uniref:receptor-like protein EIX1 n=1 Tax=Pistacia vera TaxID=55513 RepID=UPI0012637C0C|nr:receptor-like protein EIX1 [Pistacia vera]